MAKKKKILFIGDSIIEGILGVDFLPEVMKHFPEWTWVNKGIGGDTLIGISKRFLGELKKKNSYDLIVFEAGHNDLIIPQLEQMGFPFTMSAKSLKARGSVPADNLHHFSQLYDDVLRKAKDLTSSPIIITTLSCLNEDQNFILNQQRKEYNGVIRKVAYNNKCILADIGEYFDAELEGAEQTDFFLGTPMQVLLTDLLHSQIIQAPDKLSEQRGLHLTIDGVHLNTAGAKIYEKIVVKAVQETGKTQKNGREVRD
ncbi:MAG: SGNH/GDSL hydrolase family protein [Spirochaetia bacterium]